MSDVDEKNGPVESAEGLDDEGVRQRLEAWIPEIVRKALSAGMATVDLTEDGIRKIAQKAPRDVAGYIANTAGATKEEVYRVVSREIRDFLESMNLGEEIAKMLTLLTLEVKTEIRFQANPNSDGKIEPTLSKTNVKLKDNERGDGIFRRIRRKTDAPEDS